MTHETSTLALQQDDNSPAELYQILVPSALRVPWTEAENPVSLYSYLIKLKPERCHREYADFALFVKSRLHEEAERMHLDLDLGGDSVMQVDLEPFGITQFEGDEIKHAQNFQELWLKIIYSRNDLLSDSFELGRQYQDVGSLSTFYLLLPVMIHDDRLGIDWRTVRGHLASPICREPTDVCSGFESLKFANGSFSINEILNSLVVTLSNGFFYCIVDILYDLNGHSILEARNQSYIEYFKGRGIDLLYPGQPLLKAKPLYKVKRLMCHVERTEPGKKEKPDYSVELPPEICALKLFHFSKEIVSTIVLIPSIMHFLENLLVAAELKVLFSTSFPQGSEVSVRRILEALTTAACMEPFSLERLEVLGDAFINYMVGRHLFMSNESFDEGKLTMMRSSIVSNQNLYELAVKRNLQGYIRNKQVDPSCFFPLGRPCMVTCDEIVSKTIHSLGGNGKENDGENLHHIRCGKNHQWLRRKTIADVVEALVGAFLVDNGFLAAKAFLQWIGVEVGFDIIDIHKIYDASWENMLLMDLIDTNEVENRLGYKFSHRGLLIQAFLHPSHKKSKGVSYQKLEFLGDAVLGYVVISYLYSTYPSMTPGVLTDWKSAAVNNVTFAHLAISQSFHRYLISDSAGLSYAISLFENYIQLSKSERGSCQEPRCPKVLGDLVESCVGAILLDSSFSLEPIWKFVRSLLFALVKFSCMPLNPVRELRELCSLKKFEVEFSRPTLSGSCKEFLVEARVKTQAGVWISRAIGSNKKHAECSAAEGALSKLQVQGHIHPVKFLNKLDQSDGHIPPQLMGYDEISTFTGENTVMQLEHAHDMGTDMSISFDVGADSNVVNSQNFWEACNDFYNKHISCLPCIITAKTILCELCTANCWKPPCFIVCLEDGPCHVKMFNCKVTVEVEETIALIVESFSGPMFKKKSAAHFAAVGALWYLRHLGY